MVIESNTDFTALSPEDLLPHLRLAIKKGIFSRAKSPGPLRTEQHLLDRLDQLVSDPERYYFIYTSASVMLAGLWIKGQQLIDLVQSYVNNTKQNEYIELKNCYIINMNKQVRDEEVTWFTGIEGKIGNNMHIQVRVMAGEE